MNIKKIVFLVLILFTLFQQGECATQRKIDAVVGWAKPPYVNAMNDSGFEIELVKSIFKLNHIPVKFSYVPYGRTPLLVEKNKFDVALTISKKHNIKDAFLSESYISYHNAVVTLKSNKLSITRAQDLADLPVAGFQNASKVLGENFNAMTKQNALYFEVPDQKHQVELLLLGRVQAAVLDVNIFNYLSTQIAGRNIMNNVDIHYLFPESQYLLACRKKEICDVFNIGLTEFKKSDDYRELLKKYNFIKKK